MKATDIKLDMRVKHYKTGATGTVTAKGFDGMAEVKWDATGQVFPIWPEYINDLQP